MLPQQDKQTLTWFFKADAEQYIYTYTLTKTVDFKILNLWARCFLGKQSKLALSIYNTLKNKQDKGEYSSPWISKIKDTLDKLGFSYIWINQDPVNINWFKHTIKQKMSNVYKLKWKEEVESVKCWCRIYKHFKTEQRFEKYLVELEPKHSIPTL